MCMKIKPCSVCQTDTSLGDAEAVCALAGSVHRAGGGDHTEHGLAAQGQRLCEGPDQSPAQVTHM